MQNRSVLLITALALVVFYPALFFDFAYDDLHQIHNHGLVTASIISFSTILFPFFEPTFPGDLFRPIAVFTYRINFLLGGLSPFGYHAVNLLLHALCSVLVYLLAVDLSRSRGASLVAALWFAVHPIHVEAVANVVGRAELLAAAFGMGAVICFRHACVEEHRRRQLALFGWAAFAFVVAILSKESAMSLLPLIPLYAVVTVETGPANRRKLNRRALKGLLIFVGATVVYLVYRWVILQDLFLPVRDLKTYYVENPLLQEPFLTRIIPGIKILGDYLQLLVLPLKLSADYSLGKQEFWSSVFSDRGWFSIILVALFALLVWAFRRRRLAFFGLWALVTFSLTLNILFPIGTIMGERLAYVPSAGFVIFVTLLLSHCAKSLQWTILTRRWVIAIFLAFYAGLTLNRLPDWRDSETIFRVTLGDSPNSPKAFVNYGMHLYTKEKRYEEAELYFRRAIEMDPGRLQPYKYLINSLIFQHKFEQADGWIRKALLVAPDDMSLITTMERLQNMRIDLEDLLVDPTREQRPVT